MSVNVNARRVNRAIYVKKAQDLHLLTIRNISKLKKTYSLCVTDDMLVTTKAICRCAAMADAIYIHQYSPKTMFLVREKHLMEALAHAKNMRINIEILWRLMLQGDDRFGNKEEMQKVFETWADLLNEVTALLNKIKQSDEDRWKNWQPKRKDKKNKKQ